MTAYTWPGFPVTRFEMRVQQNLRSFTGPYAPTTQSLDLLGERWGVSMTLAPTSTAQDDITAASLEAYWDRLRGQVNAIIIGHVRRVRPLGTMRGAIPSVWTSGATPSAWTPGGWVSGTPVLAAGVAQLASTAVISTTVGRTLLAGDMLGLGTQLVRNLVNTVADAFGRMPIEFTPRARTAIPAGTAVLWDGPTATFILKPGTLGVPTSWTPGVVDGATVELIETY